MSATPRLYLSADLSTQARFDLDQDQAGYLFRVLRLTEGASVRVFNGRDGEWSARVDHIGKRGGALVCRRQERTQAASPDIWLLFAPLKKARTDFVVEKATELGVRRIAPVTTARTQSDRVRVDRLERLAIEAAEQTERLDLPLISPPQGLRTYLADWPEGRRLFYADEAGDDGAKPWGGEVGRAAPALTAFQGAGPGPAALLIGPEGGFAPEERAQLRAQPFVTPIGLGPRILRAETAVAAGLALWQAACGDWGATRT